MARTSFADKVKAIKPYVNWRGINGKSKEYPKGRTEANKRKLVNDYYRTLFGYTFKDENGQLQRELGLAGGLKYEVTPAQVNKGRAKVISKQQLQELSGTPQKQYLKGAWFDSIQGKSGKLIKPKIGKARNGDLFWHVEQVKFGFLKLRRRQLALDPSNELDRVLAKTDAKRFLIKCGKYMSGLQESRRTVKETVVDWMGRYNNWGLWLTGLVPITFVKQKGFDEYQEHRQATVKANKRKRQAAARAAKKAKRK